jgi:CheY-like chemotaxis protein
MPRILFVDDYQDSLTMWAFYLRSRGFDVMTANDGPSAISQAVKSRPDVVVTDLVLPGMDGCEMAKRLRALPSMGNLPIIAATGDTDPVHLQAARMAGFVRIMIKPCDPPKLVDEIDRVLAMHAPVT